MLFPSLLIHFDTFRELSSSVSVGVFMVACKNCHQHVLDYSMADLWAFHGRGGIGWLMEVHSAHALHIIAATAISYYEINPKEPPIRGCSFKQVAL